MLKLTNVFKSMDETIFKGIEEIKAQPPIQKIIDELNARPEEQQKIINHLFSIVVILLPLLLTLFLFWQNISLKSEIETRQYILEEVAANSLKKNQLDLTGRNIIGPGEITERSDLQRLVRSSLSSSNVTPENITIMDFAQNQAGEGLTQTSATLNFTNFSTQELTSLFQDLIQRQKVKISAIQVEKKEQEKLLEGSFQIYHFSKLQEDGQ
jgi:type II secretory pathway component PulM